MDQTCRFALHRKHRKDHHGYVLPTKEPKVQGYICESFGVLANQLKVLLMKDCRNIQNLDNIRICSNWYDLYDQWVQSRLSLAKERIQEYSDRLKERREALNKSNDPSGGPRRLLSQPTVDLSEFEEFQLDLVCTVSFPSIRCIPICY